MKNVVKDVVLNEVIKELSKKHSKKEEIISIMLEKYVKMGYNINEFEKDISIFYKT